MMRRILLQPHPDIRYGVERATIALFDTRTDEVHRLEYPEAAVWDMVCRGYDEAAVVDVLQYVLHVTVSHAQAIASDALQTLCDRGFLIPRGEP